MFIGEQLRRAREAQSISLDQAAQSTHIRVRYLEALEASQYDLFPSSAQVRGFLRAYGDYLKLNSSELLLELEQDTKAGQKTPSLLAASEKISPVTTNSSEIFKEIGQKLRSQRELMGLSLGDVERHTHIRMHYVSALEEGDIAHLPSPVQGRGMLSNYATFLGLNSEDILLRFADGLQADLYDRQAARNPRSNKKHPGEAGGTSPQPSKLRRLISIDLFAGGFLILFLLGFTIWGGLRVSALRSSQEPSPTAPPVSELLLSTQGENPSNSLSLTPSIISPTISAPVVEAPPLQENPPVTVSTTPEINKPTPYAGNAPIQVYVVASQPAWMRITVDGEIIFEDRTLAGSAYTFAGNEEVVLRTGNGGGIQVYYNQQDLGTLGAFGEVVERVFSIYGVLTATPRIQPTGTPTPTGTPAPSSTPSPTGTLVTPSVTPAP